MYFKTLKKPLKAVQSLHKRLVVVVMGVLCLSSCSLKMGDSNLSPETLKATEGLDCVGSIKTALDTYLKGHLSEAQISQTFLCLNQSVKHFENLTRGESLSGYSIDELKNFWSRHFSATVNPEFIESVFRLKSFLLGSSKQQITRTEWQQFVKWLKAFEQEALRLNSHIDVYTLRATDVSPDRWQAAQKKLRLLAHRVGEFLKTSPQSYKIIQHSMQQSTDGHRVMFGLVTGHEWFRYAGFIKQNLVGGPYDYIHPHQWPALVSALADWYILYLEYHYSLKRPLLYGKGFSSLTHLVQGLYTRLRQVLLAQNENLPTQPPGQRPAQMPGFFKSLDMAPVDFETQHRGTYLPYINIVKIAELLEHFEKMPYNLRVSTVEKVLPFLLERTFKSPHDPYHAKGLTLKQLDLIKKEWDLWVKTQNQLHQVFQSKAAVQNSKPFKKPDFLGLKILVDNLRPHFRPGEEKIYFNFDNEMQASGATYSLADLSRKNIFRALIQLLMRAMSSQKDKLPALRSLSQDEMNLFYLSVRPLGVDLEFMSPSSCTAGVRTFMESNIFTFVGDGVTVDAKGSMPYPASEMSFSEGVEWLTFVYSGLKMAQPLYDHALKKCEFIKKQIDKDVSRMHVDRSCFSRILYNRLPQHLDNLPYMQEYLAGLKRENYVQLLSNLEQASYKKSLQWVTQGEINHIMTILQYVESTFLQFDSNKNFVLDHDELWQAYEKFKGYIKYEGGQQFEYIARASREVADEILEPQVVVKRDPLADLRRLPGGQAAISRYQAHSFDVFGLVKNWFRSLQRMLREHVQPRVLKHIVGEFDDTWARVFFRFFIEQHRMPEGMELARLYVARLKHKLGFSKDTQNTRLSATRADFIHFMAQMKQSSVSDNESCL